MNLKINHEKYGVSLLQRKFLAYLGVGCVGSIVQFQIKLTSPGTQPSPVFLLHSREKLIGCAHLHSEIAHGI